MQRIKKSILFLFLILLFISPISVKASTTEPKVYRGSADRTDITDVMQDYADGKYNNINDDVMKKGTSKINNTVGYATSVVIILLYACMVVVTGIDLSFIGIPRLRPILYSGYGQQQQSTNRNINNNNSKPTCLITNELRVLVDAQLPQNVLLNEYIKKRAFILIWAAGLWIAGSRRLRRRHPWKRENPSLPICTTARRRGTAILMYIM